MAVPYTFAGATSSIPLSQLDTNFASTITLGNTAIQLGNTVTTLNNMTLANVTISSGNVTITNVTVTTANVTVGNITTLTGTSATYTNIASGNVTITGGTLNNVAIGGTTAASGAFTTLSASGAFSLTGDQVQISEGGTGQTTANAAFNALAPSQTGNSGKYLKTDGTDTSWDAIDINTADITGTLPILNGGTGQTTANAAFNALAPSQTSQSGKYLKTDGTNASWDALDISTADITGTLPIANGGTGLSALGTGVQSALGQAVTGSGSFVLSTSPSLTTPNLGTPSAAVLTNATGLPLTTGVTGTLGVANGGTGITAFGTGVATALGQNVTGSGGIVLATSPVLTTPNLGTPSAATLTNATGLPISTGVSGLGTNVATALAVNVGTAGAFVVNGGALGTPSGGTLTNCTGYPTSALSGSINLATQVTGTLATTNGGTGLTSFTANGVVYASSSSALTTGSALTFDGTNSYLGIGPGVTPTKSLTIYNPSIDTEIRLQTGTKNFYLSQRNSSGQVDYIVADNAAQTWSVNNAEQMRLTSTGLGIGTSSPLARLTVSDSSNPNSGTMTLGDNASFNGTLQYLIGPGELRISQVGSSSLGTTFYTNGAERMRLDSSGNLGLGVTPSAWNANNKSIIQLQNTANLFTRSTGLFATSNVVYNSADTGVFQANGYGLMYQQNQTAGTHVWLNTPNNTSGAGATASLTSAMTLDASGNLLLNTTSNSGGHRLVVSQTNASGVAAIHLPFDESTILGPTANTNITMGSNLYVRASSVLGFSTNNTERARITSGGYFKASDNGTYVNGTYHELTQSAANTTAYFANTNATAANNYGINISYRNADPNGTGNHFIYCEGNGVTQRMSVRSNGGIANYQSNNVDLSDARTKKEITPAPSYWDKIGALEIVTYKYNDQTHDDVNVGVIAQQVESVEPVWVDSDGWGEAPEDGIPLKTVYTKDITFAAIKALQEAMERIEQLEAKVAALEAK